MGSLNYFDDITHKPPPPDFKSIIETLKLNEFDIEFSTNRYRPFLLSLVGLLLEPFSFLRQKVLRGTWELYGFESIIHAKKQPSKI